MANGLRKGSGPSFRAAIVEVVEFNGRKLDQTPGHAATRHGESLWRPKQDLTPRRKDAKKERAGTTNQRGGSRMVFGSSSCC